MPEFAGSGLAVVNERAQRVVPEAPLVRRGRVFFLRVRAHQGGIEINDQRVRGADDVTGAVLTSDRPRGLAAVARAVLIAGASAARVVNSRDTVASEATDPNTPGSSRRSATSARQSPPNATATARSSRILPGSWMANGLRHGANAADNPAARPVFSAVRSNAMAPACDTTPRPVVSTDNDGYSDVDSLT